jgi:hypothetical protein
MARGLGEKWPEVEDGLTRRSHLSVGSTCQWKRERMGVPIRLDPGWAGLVRAAAGLLPGWAPGTAQVGLLAFSSYFLFSISFTDFAY